MVKFRFWRKLQTVRGDCDCCGGTGIKRKPKYKRCPNCGGEGWDADWGGTKTCDWCNGSGEVLNT